MPQQFKQIFLLGKLAPFFIALSVTFVFGLSLRAGLFTGQELLLEDILLPRATLSHEVVLVTIDDEALASFGQWPWPRATFAKLLAKLDEARPQGAVLDVVFAEPSRLGDDDDSALEKTLQTLSYPLVFPIESRGKGSTVGPQKRFFEGKPGVFLGHANLTIDADGVVRHVPAALSIGKENYAPLGIELLLRSGRSELSLPAVDERLSYAGGPGTVPHISAAALLNDSPVLQKLAGKLVFFGATAPDLHDEQITPVSRGLAMSGVEIQAQLASMVLTGAHTRSVTFATMTLVLLLAALLPALLFLFMRERVLIPVLLALFSTLLLVILAAFLAETGLLLNLLHLVLVSLATTGALLVHRTLLGDKKRRELRRIFGKYVSRDVLEELLQHPEKVELGGEEREVTVFFSDVRGFTTLSEQLSPKGLTELLNRYLTAMTDIILGQRGVVDKYIGDAIMAFWGAPMENKKHALFAVRTALAMIPALDAVNEENKRLGEPTIAVGIGLNSGPVIVGNMGSRERFDYTVMGDTVNLAARLEGQTKTYGIRLLIAEGTRGMLTDEDVAREGFLLRELDRIKVKGKHEPVTVFEVVESARVGVVQGIITQFHAARASYYEGAWQTCISTCNEILAQSDDGPTKVYLERATHFLEHPPESWTGVYELKTK